MKFVILALFFNLCIGFLAAADLSYQQKYDEKYKEIRQGQLYSDYVWEFMEIVNNVTDYKMINPIMFPFEEEFKRADNETHLDDLQIFYGGDYDTGHYTCTFYNASLNSVFVYDNMTDVCNRTKNYISMRYQNATVVPVATVAKNIDEESCGVLAIAFATAVVFHQDPATYPFKIDHHLKSKTQTLRQHLTKILAQNRLEMFPSK